MATLLLKFASISVQTLITRISLTICATCVRSHAPRAHTPNCVSLATLDISFIQVPACKVVQLSQSLRLQIQIESVVQLSNALKVFML